MLGEYITDKTKLVCVTLMSNVLGTINPIREIADAAHAVGARVLVDAAQAAPHLKFDVNELDADFLEGAKGAGLMGLAGHRSVGGMRASIYNAMNLAGVEALIEYMRDFERRHG